MMSKSELKPLEINGITAVTLGTIAWSLVLFALLINFKWIESQGKTNWIWISLSGIVLGVIGFRYVKKRSRKLSLLEAQTRSDLIRDFE